MTVILNMQSLTFPGAFLPRSRQGVRAEADDVRLKTPRSPT